MGITDLSVDELLAGADIVTDREEQLVRAWVRDEGYRPGLVRIRLTELRSRFYCWCQHFGHNPGTLYDHRKMTRIFKKLWKVTSARNNYWAHISREIGRVSRRSRAEGGKGIVGGSTPGGVGSSS